MIKSIWLNKINLIKFLLIVIPLSIIFKANAQNIQDRIISQNNSNSNSNKSKPVLFKPTNEGTPKGGTSVGATRPENKCPQINQSITPLVAYNGKDYTLSAHPTFWFYLPYQGESIKYLEFALKNTQTNSTVYRTAIKPENASGIIKITIPAEEKFALQTDINYIWELTLLCQKNRTYEPDIVRNGWIQKLGSDNQILEKQLQQLSPLETYEFYADNEIWYDSVNQIAQLYLYNPDKNPQVNQQWLNLLTTLEPEWLNIIDNSELSSEQKQEQKQNLLNVLAILRNVETSQNLLINSQLLPPDLQ